MGLEPTGPADPASNYAPRISCIAAAGLSDLRPIETDHDAGAGYFTDSPPGVNHIRDARKMVSTSPDYSMKVADNQRFREFLYLSLD